MSRNEYTDISDFIESTRTHLNQTGIGYVTSRLYGSHLIRQVTRLSLDLPSYIFTEHRPLNIDTFISLAEQFSGTPQRSLVRDRANSVDLDTLINYRSFRNLLMGLFTEGGITYERVLVLFFFCSDLAIRAIKCKLHQYFDAMYNWTNRFFDDILAVRIEQAGGWVALLDNSIHSFSRITSVTICCLTILSLYIYFKKLR